MKPAVHDLVVLTERACARLCAGSPTWVNASLARAPFAVVRREQRADRVCIGIRGGDRSERYGSIIARDEFERSIAPEELVSAAPPRAHAVFSAMQFVARVAGEYDFPWGPAGSAAFELATGVPVLTDASDLDIILHIHPHDERIVAIARALSGAPVRIDAELFFDDGCGAALTEAARGSTLLIKTPSGPRLLDEAMR